MVEEKKLVGKVTHYFPKVQAAVVMLESALKVGDRVKFIAPNGAEFEQEISSIQVDREPISEAKAGDEIGIGVSEPVKEGFEVFAI